LIKFSLDILAENKHKVYISISLPPLDVLFGKEVFLHMMMIDRY